MPLVLHNPHAVAAAIATRPGDVQELRLHAQRPSRAWQDAVDAAQSVGIPVSQGAPRGSGGRRGRRPAVPQSERVGAGEALVRARTPLELNRLFQNVPAPDAATGLPALWLALDCLQDPHNVGAIFRTAAFFAVRGIVVTKDRSAPLNATVYDTAAGGMEHVPFSVVPNLSRALQLAQQAGVWLLGSSEHAERDVTEVDRRRPWLLVLGNEERGLRRLTAEQCDEMCRLTPRGGVGSLNVSVATGSLLTVLTLPQLHQ